jgi:hypothetical protein
LLASQPFLSHVALFTELRNVVGALGAPTMFGLLPSLSIIFPSLSFVYLKQSSSSLAIF